MIGGQIFLHFVSTWDWANQALIFRPRTPAQARVVRAEAARAGCRPLPIWIDKNVPYTRGSIDGSGSQVVCINTGMADGAATRVEIGMAERLNVRTDRGRPMFGAANGQFKKGYPCYPDEVRMGPAVARGTYCATTEESLAAKNARPFDMPAFVGHTFFKPYTVTLDFAEMNLYITGDELSS